MTSTTNPTPPLKTCVGCGQPIPQGAEGLVTVASKGHAKTIHTHESQACRDAGHRVTMNDPTWKVDPTYRAS